MGGGIAFCLGVFTGLFVAIALSSNEIHKHRRLSAWLRSELAKMKRTAARSPLDDPAQTAKRQDAGVEQLETERPSEEGAE